MRKSSSRSLLLAFAGFSLSFVIASPFAFLDFGGVISDLKAQRSIAAGFINLSVTLLPLPRISCQTTQIQTTTAHFFMIRSFDYWVTLEKTENSSLSGIRKPNEWELSKRMLQLLETSSFFLDFSIAFHNITMG